MKKTIFKEILITLLIIVALGLVLAVVFYQYIPSNKAIPSKVTAYQATEEVAKEIQEDSESELTKQNQTYEITDADLSMYKKNDSYRPGKVDPFGPASAKPTGNETGGSSTVNQVEVQDRNTTDNYYTAANVNSSTK